MKPPIRLIVLGWVCCLCGVGCGPSAPRTTLHQAAENGNLWAIQKHIAAKSDLNKKDLAGWAPLHLAAMKGDVAIVKALCEAGADVNQKGKEGKTPVDVAREKGQPAVVKFLKEYTPQNAQKPGEPGRRLIDGGLGVGEVLDSGL